MPEELGTVSLSRYAITGYAASRLILFPLILVIAVSFAGCAGRTWDYVALGDSYPAGYGAQKSYVDYYAEYIQADLGVQVKVHNFSRTGLTTAALLNQVRNDEQIRIALQDAEVITIWIGWNDFTGSLAQYKAETCGGDENLDCISNATRTFDQNIGLILDELLTLADPQNTIIRIADVGIPALFIHDWQQQGQFERLRNPAFEAWRNYLVNAANQRNLTIVPAYHTLNGSDGDELIPGIYQSDGIHFNDKGQRLIADLHREAGYAYAP